MKRFVISILAVLSVFSSARAQNAAPFMADKIPSDAVMFIGWKSAGDIGGAYENSNLKKIVDASDLPKVTGEFLDRLGMKLRQLNGREGEKLSAVLRMFRYISSYSSSIYVGPVDVSNPRDPLPHVIILCSAGAAAEQVKTDIEKIVGGKGEAPRAIPLSVSVDNQVVRFEIGTGQMGQPLSEDAQFKKALAMGKSDASQLFYISGKGLTACVNDLAGTARNPNVRVTAAAVVDALGLNGVDFFVATGGFTGPNREDHIDIATTGPRKGLLKLFDNQPLSRDLLSKIPESSTTAIACHFDLAMIANEIRAGIARVDPKSVEKYEDGLDMVAKFINMDLEKDLLAPLGNEWAVYIDPKVGGGGILGGVLINHLRDPAKFEQAAMKLENQANNVMGPLLALNRMSMSFRTGEYDGIKYHYLTSPGLSPAWTIKDGNLYVSLYPQVLVSAIANQSGGKSILDNPSFMAIQKQLGGDKQPTSISYLDIPRTAGGAYQIWLLISRIGFGMADLFGVQAPPMVIPPYHKIEPLLAPAGSLAWSDEAGWHCRSIAPFPGAELLNLGGMVNAVVPASAVMTSMALPALNRSREMAMRTQSMSNLRQIGMACMLYANENRGKYPADFAEMIKTQDIGVEAFVSAQSETPIPDEIRNGTPDQKADWVMKNSSYIYFGKGKNTNADPQTVIAAEKEDANFGQGVGILYADGHVEFQSGPRAKEIINRAKANTGKKLPTGDDGL